MDTDISHYVLHADLDAFYASVEQTDNLSLMGKPVVVGGSPESRGVVAAASYEARKYGIYSAMPMGTAIKVCPGLVRVPPRFDRYRQVSSQVMDVFRNVTRIVEPLSLDEAYLDFETRLSMCEASRVAEYIRGQVRVATNLTITIGGGVSKTVSKIASQVAKPNGLLLIAPGDEAAFLAPLDVEIISGVGPKTGLILKTQGIKTLGDLANIDQNWLLKNLGKRGADLKIRAVGIDKNMVQPYKESKSVSAETTMLKDVGTEALLLEELRRLSKSVSTRLRKATLKGRTVTLKLRLANFTTFTRQRTLNMEINDESSVFQVAYSLLRHELTVSRTFRLIGVGVTNFSRSSQLSFMELDTVNVAPDIWTDRVE